MASGGEIVTGLTFGIMLHVVINALLPTLMNFVQGMNFGGVARKI